MKSQEVKVFTCMSIFITVMCIGLLVYHVRQPDGGDGQHPTCDYNDGTIASNGVSTCDMDYKTTFSPAQVKKIEIICDNGYIVNASLKSSEKSCMQPDGSTSGYTDCLEDMDNTSCTIKFKDGCIEDEHITTESISCIPL